VPSSVSRVAPAPGPGYHGVVDDWQIMSSRLTDSPVSGVPLAKRVFLIAGLIYAFSLGTRLMFLAEAVRDPMLRTPAVDEFTNWQVAEAILRGRLAPTPYIRAPGYLYLLAGLSALTGQESFLVRASQACLDAFGPVLMFLIGRRLFGPFAGVVAGLLGAVFWTCVLFSCQLVDTSLTCLSACASPTCWCDSPTTGGGSGWRVGSPQASLPSLALISWCLSR
jgi:hypothetical protein